MADNPEQPEFVGTVLAGPVQDFLNYRDIMTSARLNQAACRALTVEEGSARKLCVHHLAIDEGGGPDSDCEDDGKEVLRHIYVPTLRAISLRGCRADLSLPLSFAAGLAASRDWHVTDVSIWEEHSFDEDVAEEEDEEGEADHWGRALKHFVTTLAGYEPPSELQRFPSRLQRFRLFHSSPLKELTLHAFTAALAGSLLLRHAEIMFHETAPFRVPDGWTRTDCSIVFHREMETWPIPFGPPSARVGGLRVPYRRFPDLRPPPVVRRDTVSGELVAAPSMIVISHTVGTEDSAISQFRRTGILQHFLITERGELLQFVDTEKRAWHAGISFWGPLGRPATPGTMCTNDVNSHSIGITLTGNGTAYPFEPTQYTTLRALLAQMKQRYGITGDNIVGLGEVAYPPGRHDAPGRFFNWDALENYDSAFLSRRRLAERVRLLPSSDGDPEDWSLLFGLLRECGYGVQDYRMHLVSRIKQMADRYLGPSVDYTPRDVLSCAQALASWRRDLLHARG